MDGAFSMIKSSKATPSKSLQVVPLPNTKRKRTLGFPAKSDKQCLALTQPLLPLPPRQLPLVGFTLPAQPCLGFAKCAQIGNGGDIVPIAVQAIGRLVDGTYVGPVCPAIEGILQICAIVLILRLPPDIETNVWIWQRREIKTRTFYKRALPQAIKGARKSTYHPTILTGSRRVDNRFARHPQAQSLPAPPEVQPPAEASKSS
jgi:hypothetical protein